MGARRVAALLLLCSFAIAQASLTIPVDRKKYNHPGCYNGGHYEFSEYVPSSWEQQWYDLAEAGTVDEQACGLLKSQSDLSEEWLRGIANFTANQFTHTACFKGSSPVWSKFIMKNTCVQPQLPETMEIPIEPAVGLLRHPYGKEECTPDGKAAVWVQDRRYLLINAIDPMLFSAMYPGRRLLFDLGTNSFESSLGWTTEHYANAGLVFDEIWSWEMKKADPTEFWDSVPGNIAPRLHFYNVGVKKLSDNPDHPAHPVNILKNIYQKGDYVVFKVDIDNQPIESDIMEALGEDPEVSGMVAEVFFEKHFDHPVMKPHFGDSNGCNLKDTIMLFRKLRQAGVRLHYWP